MGTRKKLAIVRGSNLNKWEMQNFEPLSDFYDVTGFNGKNGFFDTSTITFPVKTLRSLEKRKSSVPGLTMASKAYAGSSQKLSGLQRALKDYDVVHTVGTETYYTKQCILAKKKNPKLKVVATIWENIPFAHEDFKKQKELKAFNLAGIDHFVAMSDRAAYALKMEGVSVDKITTIYIGVDLEKFQPRDVDVSFKKSLGFSEDDIVVTSVGRLVWEKGILDVLFAFADMKKRVANNNYKLLLVGKGALQKRVAYLVAKLGLEKDVVITTVPYGDIPKVFNMSDVFVLPSIPVRSWQEQLGMVFIEAMGSGVPVIAGHSGSIDEVIGDAGVLVSPADSMMLSKELERLCENESLREEMGFRGRKRAEKMFDSRMKWREFKDVYHRVGA